MTNLAWSMVWFVAGVDCCFLALNLKSASVWERNILVINLLPRIGLEGVLLLRIAPLLILQYLLPLASTRARLGGLAVVVVSHLYLLYLYLWCLA